MTWREVLYGTEEARANSRAKTPMKDVVKGIFAIAFAVSIIFSAVHLATGGSHHHAPPSVHEMFAKEDAEIQARLTELRARARERTVPCSTTDADGMPSRLFAEPC